MEMVPSPVDPRYMGSTGVWAFAARLVQTNGAPETAGDYLPHPPKVTIQVPIFFSPTLILMLTQVGKRLRAARISEQSFLAARGCMWNM